MARRQVAEQARRPPRNS